MDAIWLFILECANLAKVGLNQAFSPLHFLGPAFTLFVIALLTALLTHILSKHIKTRRLQKLQQEFEYWYKIRHQALNSEQDQDRGKQKARDIDKGKLNELYYNYFIEGLLNNLLTKYIPVLSVLVYINHAYNPERLQAVFGREYVFSLWNQGSDPILVGSIFWFIICLVLSYIFIFALKHYLGARIRKSKETPALRGKSASAANTGMNL